MTGFAPILPEQLKRKAVIYIRQSSPNQVLTNVESRKIQHNLREYVRGLGWHDDQIIVVESDTATTGRTANHRHAYKKLIADIALGEIGIVISSESARLSRNCSDWYPLLDVCAHYSCLIGDQDGIYDPSTVNGRLILGIKGILSEVELHTLRGRLIAGVQNKARRGELALALPAGLIRQEDNKVVKDPNLQVQQAIELVFQTFLELKSAAKVIQLFNEKSIKMPRRHRNKDIVWRTASLANVVGVLKNPAYAGTFAYGKSETTMGNNPANPRPQQRRREIDDWTVVLHDRYPSYISWETFIKVQGMLRDNHAEYDRNKTRGIPRNGAALLQGLVYCGKCGHKMVVQYKNGSRYLCNYHRQQYRIPVCQYLPADPIDHVVIQAFFQALSGTELDLYEKTMQLRRQEQSEVHLAQDRELQRLRYEADLARRRYEKVDPANRLVASELERGWEETLRLLQNTEETFRQARQKEEKDLEETIPDDLRSDFQSLGKSLPELWKKETLSRSQRKAFLRCLIDKVILRRKEEHDVISTRIVWRGGEVTEIDVSVPVNSVRSLSNYEEMEKRILELEAQGISDEEIANVLTQEDYRSPMTNELLPSTVKTIRLQHGRIHRFWGPRPRKVDGFITLPQLAKKLDVKPHWIYYLIRRKFVEITRDQETKLYLFPDRPQTLEDFRQLQAGKTKKLTYINVNEKPSKPLTKKARG